MNKLVDVLLSQLLLPMVDRIPAKWKTITGFALAVGVFACHEFGYVSDTPIEWLGGSTPFQWLMGACEALFGVGLIHRAARLGEGNKQ